MDVLSFAGRCAVCGKGGTIIGRSIKTYFELPRMGTGVACLLLEPLFLNMADVGRISSHIPSGRPRLDGTIDHFDRGRDGGRGIEEVAREASPALHEHVYRRGSQVGLRFPL